MKFINPGKRDGLQLLMSMVAQRRQEERADKELALRYKMLESDMAKIQSEHLYRMAGIEQQRQQFAIESAMKQKELDYNIEFLDYKKEALSVEKTEAGIKLVGTLASVDQAHQELIDSELARQERGHASVTRLVQNASLTRGEALSGLVYGQEMSNGSIDTRFSNTQVASLFESLASGIKGNVDSSEREAFAASILSGIESGLDNYGHLETTSRNREALQYGVEKAVVGFLTAHQNDLSDDLKNAVNNWHIDREGQFEFISAAIGSGKLDRKFDNKKFQKTPSNPALITRVANSVGMNNGVSGHISSYVDSKRMKESVDDLIARSEDHLARADVRHGIATGYITKKLNEIFPGSEYLEGHPIIGPRLNGEKGGSKEEEDESTGGGLRDLSNEIAKNESPTERRKREERKRKELKRENERKADAKRLDDLTFKPEDFIEFGNFTDEQAAIAMSVGVEPVMVNGKRFFKVGDYYNSKNEFVEGQYIGLPHHSRIIGTPDKFSMGEVSKHMSDKFDRLYRNNEKAKRIREAKKRGPVFGGPETPWTTPIYQEFPDPNDPANFVPDNIEPGEGFVEGVRGEIQRQATERGMENPELIAQLGSIQSGLETGHGKNMTGNNYFNIKGSGPDSHEVNTHEFVDGEKVPVKDSFKSYSGIKDSVSDYLDTMHLDRYSEVLSSRSIDEAIEAVGKSGYATDPEYAVKLRRMVYGDKKVDDEIKALKATGAINRRF